MRKKSKRKSVAAKPRTPGPLFKRLFKFLQVAVGKSCARGLLYFVTKVVVIALVELFGPAPD